jgi:hypothetical protein
MRLIHHTIPRAALALFGLLGPGTASASAQCLANEIQKLTASDASLGDHFGVSVSIVGDLAVVGAQWANVGEYLGGAAYVYLLDSSTKQWVEQQKLVPADPGPQDEFGFPVAINPVDPTLIIVGARLDDDACPDDVWCQSGSAYIFRFDPNTAQWAQEQKLTASDADIQDHFGIAVAMWGNVAVIGADREDEAAMNAGAVYVFRFDPVKKQWYEEAKLLPLNNDAGNMGQSVAIQDDVIAAGAPADFEQGFAAGATHIYRFDHDAQMWVEEQKLLASDPAESSFFGRSVSLDGDTVLIGAHLADAPPLFSTGAAYVFRFDGGQWNEEQKLVASDGAFWDQFGQSVSLTGQTALSGALLDDDVGNASGSAYVFTYERGAWIERAKLHSSDIEASDLFGASVAIDQDRALVGATNDDDDGSESGSAYVFGSLGDCNENGELDLCDIADGFSPDDNNNGIPDECEPPPCPWDFDNSGDVGVKDLLFLLGSWGPCPPKGDCPADFDNSGDVGVKDLLVLLGNWGPCP